jgi:hypothetical protein
MEAGQTCCPSYMAMPNGKHACVNIISPDRFLKTHLFQNSALMGKDFLMTM